MITVDATRQSELTLRVAADTTGPSGATTAYSEVAVLPVIRALTPAEVDRAMQLLGDARAQYDSLVATYGRVQGAANTVEWLEGQADVVDAQSREEGYFVTWRISISEDRTIPFGLGAGPRGTMSNPQIKVPKALILEPFFDEWLAKDAHITNQVRDDLELTRCPKIHPIQPYPGPFASVRQFHSMSDYGLVFINSHGGTHGFKGESEGSGCIQTEEPALDSDWNHPGGKYAVDIVKERLIVWMANPTTPSYVITPRFVEHYTSFDRAIVVNSACFGLSDVHAVTPLHKAFVKTAGAAVYIGFTGKVGIVYGGNWVKKFSESLVAGQTVSEAYVTAGTEVGPFDPSRPWVMPLLVTDAPGDENLTITWDCDGYMRVTTTGPGTSDSYQAFHRITQGEPGRFHAVETRASCLGSMQQTMDYGGGVTVKLWSSRTGRWAGEIEEPYPVLLSVSPGNSGVEFYDGVYPPSDDWVVFVSGASGSETLTEFTSCPFGPPTGLVNDGVEVIINDGVEVIITDSAIEGSISFPVQNGSYLVEFKYELDGQPEEPGD